MADQDDPLGGNPFGNIPLFGDLAKALAGQGPLNWDAARQFAQLASEGATTSAGNVDPAVRIALADLGRIAELHVRDVTGLDPVFPEITAVTPGTWAQRTLEAYRPLFTELATSLGRRPTLPRRRTRCRARRHRPRRRRRPDDGHDGQPQRADGPVDDGHGGRLDGRADGHPGVRPVRPADPPGRQHDAHRAGQPRPLRHRVGGAPRPDAPVGPGPRDDRPRRCSRSPRCATTTPHWCAATSAPSSPIRRPSPRSSPIWTWRAATRCRPSSGRCRIRRCSSARCSRPSRRRWPRSLDAATAAIIGYVDYLVDAVAARVIGGEALRIAEAVRRRRVEASPDDLYIERLLGLKLTHEQVQRGKTFIAGVVDRVGEAALSGLFARPGALPTPTEIDAPGLWLARLDLRSPRPRHEVQRRLSPGLGGGSGEPGVRSASPSAPGDAWPPRAAACAAPGR